MKTVVKSTLIILILACSCSNFGHAFDIDETVDDEIRKNYNPNQLIEDTGIKSNALEKKIQAEPIIETIDPNPCQYYNTPREDFEKVLDLLNKITDDNFYELKPVFTLKVKNNTTVKMEAINTLNMLKGQIENILKTNNCELDVRLERLKRQPTLDDVFADDLSDLSVCKKQPKQYKIYLFREFLMGYLEQYESKEKKIPIEEIVQDYVVKDGDKLVSVDKELIIARLLYVVGYINETKLRNTVKDNKFIKSGLKGINSEKIVKRSKVYW